jgi:hypothetical protein
MTRATGIVIVFSMLLATVAGLIYLAMGGDTWATGILFSIWSIICVAVGAGIVIVVNNNQAAREQRDFTNNLKENLTLMSAMQSIQNKQNSTIMQQLDKAVRLPHPTADSDNILQIPESIFSELED